MGLGDMLQAERDAEDARRYRWLRQENSKGPEAGKASIEIVLDEDGCEVESGHSPDDLDAVIDERLQNTSASEPK
jgi:hypothetical protein